MRARSIYLKAISDQRMQILGFSLTLVVIAALDVYIWPSYKETLENFELPPAFEALFGGDLNFASAAGFLSAEFYSWIPILLLVYATIQGTGAIAGDESSGTMDLLLAQPIARQTVVLERVAAAVTGAILIVIIGYAGWVVSIPFVDIEVTLWDVFVANVNMLPITLFFYGLALAAGAIAPSRGVAVAVTVGFATVTYFMQTIAAAVDALEPLRYLTPFYYYGNGRPLVDGLAWPHVGLLVGLTAVLVFVAIRAFARRDVNTGGASELSLGGALRRALALRSGV